MVVTTLCKEAAPLIRYRTRDITRIKEIMAAKDENTLDSLKEELQSLQKQFSELASAVWRAWILSS